jgi:hypothetical protein
MRKLITTLTLLLLVCGIYSQQAAAQQFGPAMKLAGPVIDDGKTKIVQITPADPSLSMENFYKTMDLFAAEGAMNEAQDATVDVVHITGVLIPGQRIVQFTVKYNDMNLNNKDNGDDRVFFNVYTSGKKPLLISKGTLSQLPDDSGLGVAQFPGTPPPFALHFRVGAWTAKFVNVALTE